MANAKAYSSKYRSLLAYFAAASRAAIRVSSVISVLAIYCKGRYRSFCQVSSRYFTHSLTSKWGLFTKKNFGHMRHAAPICDFVVMFGNILCDLDATFNILNRFAESGAGIIHPLQKTS